MFLQCVCRIVRQQLVSCLRRVQLQGHLGDHQGVHQEGSSSSCDARSWMEYSSWGNCSSCGNWIASALRMLQMAKEEAAWGNETHLGQHWGLLQGHYLLYLASLGWIQGPGTWWRSHLLEPDPRPISPRGLTWCQLRREPWRTLMMSTFKNRKDALPESSPHARFWKRPHNLDLNRI